MLTFRRPDDLAAALPRVVAHIEEVEGAELLVVDNDTAPSAAEAVEPWTLGHPVRYVHEPRPGIAAARNRGLEEAADSGVVVFVDDDERPRDGWLAALLAAYRTYPCVGVAGPVVSEFSVDLDPWIAAGGYFDRLRHATGTVVPVVATNNLLVDAAALRRLGVRFDERFGLSGGSDTVFALEVGRRGGRFVWCDEAVVVDAVPPDRITRRWVVRRAFRMGNSGARAAVHVAVGRRERAAARARWTMRGAARVLGGVVQMSRGCLMRDLRGRARGMRTLVRGAGMVSGAVGHVFSECARGSGA
jgi:succinoglycan biosynthesis protein ExoM